MYNSFFVCLMGIGTVFFGLVCIILLTKVMSAVCGKGSQTAAPAAPVAAPAAKAAPAEDASLIAAVSAVIAEEMGTSVNGIRILSMKKI